MLNSHGAEEKVAIVLATYNPKCQYFLKQIESIKQQTWQNFICYIVDDNSASACKDKMLKLVGDDSRFICLFHDSNLGSYHNFERGLNYCLLNSAVTAIAFCDQDDVWHTNKIELLIKSLRSSGALVAHSDLVLIDEEDKVVANSCWDYEGRTPENTTSRVLLIRNTVTGCAMMFRSSLLSKVLPFPKQDKIYWHHDHWVAIIAAELGKIEHIREPLINYRQHANNSLGAQKTANGVVDELSAWKVNKFRVSGNSYLVSKNFCTAFYERLNLKRKNPFDLRVFDFGLGILLLGINCFLSKNRGLGSTLRLVTIKVLLLFNVIKRN